MTVCAVTIYGPDESVTIEVPTESDACDLAHTVLSAGFSDAHARVTIESQPGYDD